jgi:hypothetical protein
MYTTRLTTIGKLREYHRALDRQYATAICQRDWAQARRVRELRWRVRRAIMIHEEWNVGAVVA